MIWMIPLTSKAKSNKFYRKISYDTGTSWASITQMRTISTKRLLRRVGMVNEDDFIQVIEEIRSHITIGLRIAARSSEAEATNRISIDESKSLSN